jgi:hypothetical protein
MKFANHAQAEAAKFRRHIVWRPPVNDLTTLQNDIDRQNYVRMIIEAMIEVDPSKIIEKQTDGFQQKWITSAFKGKLAYPGEPQKLACWDLLKIAETLHNQGPNRLTMFSNYVFKRARTITHDVCGPHR